MHFCARKAIFDLVQFHPELEETYRYMLINKRIPDFTNLALFNQRRCFMIISKPEHSLFVFHTSPKISLMQLFLPLSNYVVTHRYFSVSYNLSFMKDEDPRRKNDFNQSNCLFEHHVTIIPVYTRLYFIQHGRDLC